jgi:hypothetical protein
MKLRLTGPSPHQREEHQWSNLAGSAPKIGRHSRRLPSSVINLR